MNVSQPVSSQLGSVSFGFLSSADIRALSAKQITSATTFDTLLNPIPGGLYSSELGQFGDNACGTCGLKNPQCPGHCGHIELPVPCYHPTFMDQVLRLLRATCIYCNRLKLSRVQVHRMSCKLRLVRCGLLKEVQELDELSMRNANGAAITAGAGSDAEDSESDGDEDTRGLMSLRDRFVNDAIKTAQENGSLSQRKTEAMTNCRKAIVAEFMGMINKGKSTLR